MHAIVSWAVMLKRDEATLQAVVDQAPQATAYSSDGFPTYQTLVYDGRQPLPRCRTQAKRIRWKGAMPIYGSM